MERIHGCVEFDKNEHSNAIVTVTVRGTSPLMMHRMSDETMMELFNRTRPQRKDVTLLQKAEEGIYRRESDGRIVLPSMCLQAACVEAGRQVVYERKTMLSTKETSKVPAILDFRDEEYEIIPNPEPNGPDGEKLWTVDKRRGLLRNGANKTAVPIVRGKFKNWGFVTEIHFDPTDPKVGADKVKELIRIAGRYIGLGSFRPMCRGNFGQFVVTKFAVEYYTPPQWEEVLGISQAAK